MTKPIPKDQLYLRIDKLPATYRPYSKAGNDNNCWCAGGKCERCEVICTDRDWRTRHANVP